MPSEKIEVEHFDARLRGLLLPFGLRIDSLRLWGKALGVQTKPLEAALPDPADLEVSVTQEDLAAFLEEKAPGGLKNFKVEAKSGRLLIEATKSLIIPIKAEAECTIRIVDGRQLFVNLESVHAAGVGATNLVQTQIEKINPILDTADLPLSARLATVTIDAGVVLITGTARP